MATDGYFLLEEVTAGAIASVFSAWRDAAPQGGVLALLPEAEKGAVTLLQSAARECGMPLVGAIFPALVADGAFRADGVHLVHFQEQPPAWLIPSLNATGGAAAMVAAVRERLPTGAATLFMVFDSMVPNIASLLDELYLGLSNRVTYAGVNAGSETFQPMPCLFDNEQLVGDGVLCLLLPGHPGAVLEHGYAAPDEMVTATATQGNRIISIDWRPAFEVYRERMAAAFGVEVTAENFYRYAVHFPFGIVLANDDILVRIPVALQDDGSLFCVGEIPANAMLTLLQSPSVDSVHTVERVVSGVTALAPGSNDPLLMFYCAGRRMHLGSGAEEELALMRRQAGGRHLAGALSLGEIGALRRGGYPQFHNATLVVSPWPR